MAHFYQFNVHTYYLFHSFMNSNMKGDFICTFSLLTSLSITLQTSKFRKQFTISSKYFDMACYSKQETYSGPISFLVQRNYI